MQVIFNLYFSPLGKDSSTFMIFNLSFLRWEFRKAEEKILFKALFQTKDSVSQVKYQSV